MILMKQLKDEMAKAGSKSTLSRDYFRAIGYRNTKRKTLNEKRADGIYTLLTEPGAHIYKNDLIVGSLVPLTVVFSEKQNNVAKEIVSQYPQRSFVTNNDHYAADYQTVINIGIGGLLDKIAASEKAHKGDDDALSFLSAMRITLNGLQERLRLHANLARELIGKEGYDSERLEFIAKNCEFVVDNAPETFAQGLQLVWMIHSSFMYEGRFAMALGRLDQYLYPLYKKDIDSGVMTKDDALELVGSVIAKICEYHYFWRGADVINICIGGVDKNDKCSVNDLSYCILQVVKENNLPGPNLSARITPDTPDEFLDECLKSIGTGLGYPALMNDTVNKAALRRYGYDEEDVRNYCMVGCIENFLPGLQPPWSDTGFVTPRHLDTLLKDYLASEDPEEFGDMDTMDAFMKTFEKRLSTAVKENVDRFFRGTHIAEPEKYTNPFLSCFTYGCIEKAKDINMGGTKYPSVHGQGLIGVATTIDSLAAIEKVVYCDKEVSLKELAAALKANYEGYEELREKLIAAPKYGNNDPFVDKYAEWYTSYLSDEFDKHRTPDGGGIYAAMASNTNNIPAGKGTGATPDGRFAGEPLSDAASPTYGRDTKGATSTILSVSKPDYNRCACGTVVNQKYSPSAFEDGKRKKLLDLIKVYFARGGQEIQINATSPEILRDAMDHPENYQSLVVRVSGFSAMYVTLRREVQEDILRRTQQG